MTRPRVVHVAKFYPPVQGGIERVVASICASTADRLESRILAYNQHPGTLRELVDGVPVTRVGSVSAARSTPVAPALIGELRRSDDDVMVVHEPNPWALLSYALAKPAPPLVIWFHSEVVRPRLQYALFYHPLVQSVYGRARQIIVSSPALAQHAAALRPYADRITVIPFGVDADAWAETPAVRARAEEIRASAVPGRTVLFTGRLVAYKGVDVLLRALTAANAFALIAGDGPLRRRWEQRAAALGVADRTRFLGEVPPAELRALYRAADLFVLPSVSRAEAFGYVQLEAMASGLPVISTALPSGVPWVNQHEVTGLTVPPGDAAGLGAAMRRLLDDPGERGKMADAARDRVRREFAMDLMGERVATVFERIARVPAGAC